jgi:hypothetical protein
MVGRSPAFSGTTRRDSELVAVNIPPPDEISAPFFVGSERTIFNDDLDTRLLLLYRSAVASAALLMCDWEGTKDDTLLDCHLWYVGEVEKKHE